MDWEEFIKKINDLFMQYSYTMGLKSSDESLEFSIFGQDIKYTREEFNLIRELAENSDYDNFTIKCKTSYEAVLYEPRQNISSFSEIEKIDFLQTLDNTLSYEVSEVSDLMLYHILKNMDSSKYILTYHINIFNSYILRSGRFFTILKKFMCLPCSIKLRHKNEVSEDKLINIINSFLFDISVNYNSVFRLASDEEEVLGKGAMYHRSNKTTPIKSASNKIYKSALIDQYCLAMTNEDPMMQFIAYYHVLEYFFKTIIKERTRKSIDEVEGLEMPSEENAELKREIIKKLSCNFKNLINVREADSLLLTLENYISIDELKARLEFISASSIDYYKSNKVSFSNGSKVDLLNGTDELIFKNLRDRIYKTRNSIVHNKANEDNEDENFIYNPFENEEELRKEIPLMRAIAEQIIIKTAEEI